MKNQLIFEEQNERNRLKVQNRLLSPYEKNIFEHIFSDRQELAVLDIGCNDGTKTVERFASDAVAKVIGLEYNDSLVVKAQSDYGNGKFSFYSSDVESDNFSVQLKELMSENHVDGFDVIYLSFVLMHLQDIKKLLVELKAFLKPEGQLVIIEADDDVSVLTPDGKGLLAGFLDILKKDKYSGNREVGSRLNALLAESGYGNVTVWSDCVSAKPEEWEKKRDIFTTFFSYLPEDVALLLKAEPDCEEYKAWAKWLDENYRELEQLIVKEESSVSMGVKMVSCK